MIKCLEKCLDKNSNFSSVKLKHIKNTESFKFNRALKFLQCIYKDKSLSLNEMYKLFKQNIFQPLRCLNCNATVHLRKGNVVKQFGFALFCSNKCLCNSKYRKELTNKTCIQKYGGIGFGNKYHTEKACKTMKERYGTTYYVLATEFEEKRTKTYQEKYNVTSPMQSSKVRKVHQTNMLKNHGVSNALCKGTLRDKALFTIEKTYGNKQIMATYYMRELKENKGDWLPLDQKSNFELYCMAVDKFTIQSIRKFNITDIEKRKKFEYSLDHIYSKKQGFIDNIPPFIIGSIINLKVIPHSANSSKRDKCGMTKVQLFNLYYSAKLNL